MNPDLCCGWCGCRVRLHGYNGCNGLTGNHVYDVYCLCSHSQAEATENGYYPSQEVAFAPDPGFKAVSYKDLEDALTGYYIDQNMGMPGPRQTKLAEAIWKRL